MDYTEIESMETGNGALPNYSCESSSMVVDLLSVIGTQLIPLTDYDCKRPFTFSRRG